MKKIINIPFITFLLFATSFSFAQEVINPKVEREYDGMLWYAFSEKIMKEKDVRIYFHPDSIPSFRVSVGNTKPLLNEVIENNLIPLGFQVSSDFRGNYFIYKDKKFISKLPRMFFHAKEERPETEEIESEKKDSEYINTYDDFITKRVIIGSKQKGFSSTKAVLQGKVTDSENNKPVPQAVLYIEETNDYSTSNDSGYYKMVLPTGRYTLAVRSIGSHEKKYKLIVYSSDRLNITLDTKTYMLKEAVISSQRFHNVRDNQMGFEKLNPKAIKDLPVVLGEQDITKIATMLPGIQTIGEASSGFNVRGSPADQSVFYLNDVPIYNITHLFGFFSAINSDAVNEFSIYKSNIPIKYGGRLASIFDVGVKSGDIDHFSARGGISPVTSRVMAEGPIIKNKGSYLVSMRSTYSDWLLSLINDVEIKNSTASFADALTNLSFSLDKNNNLDFIIYGSRDKSDLNIGTENAYSNIGGSLKWDHQFNKKLSSKLSFIFSEYDFEEKMSDAAYSAYKQTFNLRHQQVRLDFDHRVSESHRFKYGFDATLYELDQGDFLPLTEESNVIPLSFEPEQGLKASLYLGDEWNISDQLSISGGLRYTNYHYLGPKTVYTFANNLPREEENIIDTLSFKNNESIKKYAGLDFRVSGKYMLSEDLSVKAGYNKLHQYMFLMTNTISVSPTDRWKLADKYIEPMSGQQYSVGLYKNFLAGMLETSVELYYKDVDNLVEYEDGANFLRNEVPEAEIIQGDLSAYGVELMVKKTFGSLNGWINYTYSNATVEAIDKKTGESNNNGKSYPANYDKPHALNISLNYKLSKRFSVSSNLIYSTGRPITYPTSIYYQDGMQITGFSQRNEYRLPDYFRMDFSMNFEGNLKKNKLAHGSWALSLYNLTSRKNAYSVYFKNVNGNIKGYRLSIFGTIIPSISYNIKIGNYDE
ncbi:MAG TPA: TonB-dependent receptor [Bacteroidales bacterium]|nr:TonB-dependent receptor [Bacteroidales bacterium]